MEKYPKIYLYRRVVEAKLFIDKHYLDGIDIDKMAEEACFSKYHFLRLFKNMYGITPHKYQSQLKIQRAKELLGRGITIKETCYSLGFESVSSFNKLFKRHVMFTPSAYAERQKHLQEKIKKEPLSYIPLSFVSYLGWNK